MPRNAATNAPSSATRRTGRNDCNPDAPAGSDANATLPQRQVGSPNCYLSFFSPFPSKSNSRFSSPVTTAPFPLSLSPSTFSLYSTLNLLSPTTRSAENVSSPSFIFTSLSFASFWFGQSIVPASLSPSFLIVRVEVRGCPPISYSHFHVPTGSTLASAALAGRQSPSTNAIERGIRGWLNRLDKKSFIDGKLIVWPLLSRAREPSRRNPGKEAKQNAWSVSN